MALGPHIKELRTRAGLSQRLLAEKVGIDVTYLSKLENGRQRASDRVLRSLAGALELEPIALLIIANRIPAELQGTLQASPPGDGAAGDHGSLAPPRYRTRFIDRDEDRSQLLRRVEAAGSLVAVTGPPGGGKTRLVAEVAADLSARGRAIAWIPVREQDPDRIEATVGLARLPPDGIVVLDDADRDLEASTAAARRLIAAGTTVVATSRQPLGMYGIPILQLAPLPVPDRHQRPSRGDDVSADLGPLGDQVSVRLFVDRATLARPDFQLDRTNAPAVFDVCRWLDGIPLAIELAALRLRQMTVADLAASTRNLVPWLTGNTPDVPDRHASMAEAIGWSFDRLDAGARAVALRLSVFESTFTLADAARVAGDDGTPPEFVHATVMELVDRSLLYWRENADRRAVYRWLRPIGQYGRQLLALEKADSAATRDRYRSWAQQVVADDLPRRESEWERLAELTPELVSAVYDLPAEEQAEAMARMTDALSKSLQFGNLSQHVGWFTRQFSGGGPEVFREAGMLARVRGEFEEATENFEQAYNIAVRHRDDAGQASAALDLAENSADRAQYQEAEEYAKRADELYERLEDDRGRIEVLNLRGKLRLETSDPLDAEELFKEGLRRSLMVEDSRLVAYSLHNLGVGDYLLRRISSARNHLEESLTLREDMRNQRGAARVIEAFALVESEVQNHDLALRLLGAARQYRQSSGMLGIPPWWQQLLDAVEQEGRVALAGEPGAADRRLVAGTWMTLAEAGTLARMSSAEGLSGLLGAPVSEPLRRSIPSPLTDLRTLAGAVAGEQAPTALDLAARELVASGGTATDAYRRLHRARLLVLGEPIDARVTDLLCFATDPSVYRGVVVPVFTSGAALADGLERCPVWASRPVLEIRFEQLRSSLVRGELAVVNPWTPSEFRVASTEIGYAPSVEVPASMEAPTARNLSISSS